MADYCLDIVRRHDPDRFLLSLFAPRKARPALWALFAFNYEIAKTREVVSDTTIGLIRLQWWRDAIAEIYEGKIVRSHEVVTPLASAIKQYDLPRDLFDNLIYAREFDLENRAPTNLEGLMKYCEFTSAPLFELALKIIGVGYNETHVVDISRHYALIGVIRAVPYMLKSRRMMLPTDILVAHKLSQQKIFDFNEKENLPKVINEVIEGQKQFRNGKSDQNLGKFLKRIDLMAKIYEDKIRLAKFDVFDKSMNIPPKFFALKLWLAVK